MISNILSLCNTLNKEVKDFYTYTYYIARSHRAEEIWARELNSLIGIDKNDPGEIYFLGSHQKKESEISDLIELYEKLSHRVHNYIHDIIMDRILVLKTTLEEQKKARFAPREYKKKNYKSCLNSLIFAYKGAPQ